MRHILSFATLLILILIAIWFAFAEYHPRLYEWLGIPVTYTVFIDEVPVIVNIADSSAERQQGLSGVTSLGEQEGMLFIFDQSDRYGMWMKDMVIPLDIIWIDVEQKIIHIEENVQPDTYPKTFSSPMPARFVLEVPAFFVDSFKIRLGQRLQLPTNLVPKDLQ